MREIQTHIKSINDIRQITKAMNLISAAKLKKARSQLEQAMPFFAKVKCTLSDIVRMDPSLSSIWLYDERKVLSGGADAAKDAAKGADGEGGARKRAYLVIAGDKNLAGGYNVNVSKATEQALAEDGGDHKLYVAGAIGYNHFIKRGYDVERDFIYQVQSPNIYRARDMAETLIERFISGEYDEVHVIYTRMVSSMSLAPERLKLFPIDSVSLLADPDVRQYHEERQGKLEGGMTDAYAFEPSLESVIAMLVGKYAKGIIYGCLVEGYASEQSSRMAAMESATSNADEMIQDLTLHYNRSRQSAITQEISEIVGGAAALE